MKGCAVAALRDFLLYLVGAALMTTAFVSGGATLSDAIAPAAFCAIPLWIGLKFLFGISQPLREKRMLARSEQPPIDGALCAISGTIHASSPLHAPLSGLPCTAFRYAISAEMGKGKNRRQMRMYEGTAVTPSTIHTKAGTYRLLAVPMFDFESELLDRATAMGNARGVIEDTKFEKPRPAMSKSRLEEEWSDDDGAYRYEVDHTSAPLPLEECRFEEFVVSQGEEITLFGRYSASRGGIVADASWANLTRLMKGGAPVIVAALGRRIKKYAIAGVIFTLVGVAAFMLISRGVTGH
jgi:hypothetical protein